MKVKQILSGILSVIMLLSVLLGSISVNVFATDSDFTDDAQPVLSEDFDVADDNSMEMLIEKQGTVTVSYSQPLLDAPVYSSIAEAGEAVRAAMKKRSTSVSLSIRTLTYYEDYDYVWLEVLSYAIMHTGVPTEGDYLLWNLYNYDAKISSYKDSVFNCYDIKFTFEYLTTYAQETELNDVVKSVLDTINVYEASDFDKIYGVYDYVCKNISFDYEHADDDSYILKHSAYAALVNKATTTNGYVTLLYRLWLELGIDNRIITGTIYGLNHAWNIFRYGNAYYNADPTLDAGAPQYVYVFRCDFTFFKDHKRDDAYKSSSFTKVYQHASSDLKFQTIFFIDDGVIIGYDGPYNDLVIPDYEGIIGIGEDAFKDDYLFSIVIPGNIKFLADNAFRDSDTLGTVTILDGLEIIGDNAFTSCDLLTDITLPESLIYIGDGAFSSCNSLSNVTLPSSLIEIGSSAFEGCKVLNDVVLPSSLIEIGSSAFKGCIGLNEIVLPSSLTEIKSNTFEGCQNLEAVILPNSLEIIGEKAFYDTGIKQIVIPSNVTQIGDYAFANNVFMNKLTFESPTSLTETGAYAFSGCGMLSSLEIPEGVTHISQSSFSGCLNISELSLPSTLVSIGENAFRQALNMKSFVIPDNVTQIGDYAFFKSTIGDLIINHDNLQIGPNAFKGEYPNQISNIYFYSRDILIPEGFDLYDSVLIGHEPTIHCYKNTDVWNYAKKHAIKTIPFDPETPSLVPIASGKCGDNLTWSLEENGHLTISGTGKIKSSPWKSSYSDSILYVTVEEGVTGICENAFSMLWNMKDIKLPSTLETIDNLALNSNPTITTIEIPDGVNTIGLHVFAWCSNLTSVKLPSQLKTIGNGAFQDCKGLKDVVLPNGVTLIDHFAFSNTALEEIEIPESVESIGNNAFANCKNLKKIVFHSKKTIITLESSIPEHTVIYGYPGSTAHEFAKKYDREFVSLVAGGELPGDVNGDCLVDNDDAIYLLYASIFGTEEYPLIQDGDYNKDGNIDNNDAIYLLYHTIFGEAEYPLS